MATLVHLLVVTSPGGSGTWAAQDHRVRPAPGGLSVSWQSTTVALAGVVIGVPAGIVVGRLVGQIFASSLGVVSAPLVTAWVIVAVAAGTMLEHV